MKFGVHLPSNFGFDNVQDVLELAKLVEDLGFDSVWVSEHIFNAGYIANRLGDRPYYAPLPVLSAVSAVTKRVRVGTSILVLPYHNPIVLAKDLATIDAVSQGRLTIGVGVGVIKEEFDALGYDHAARGKFADEAMAVMTELWTKEDPEFEGQFHSFSGLRFTPKPVQQPHPPFWIGGSSKAAMRRVATVGAGWHLFRYPEQGLAPALQQVRDKADENGRDGKALVMSARCDLDILDQSRDDSKADYNTDLGVRFRLEGTSQEIIDGIGEFERQGIDYLVLAVNTTDREKNFDMIRRFAEEIGPNFDGALVA